MTDSRIHPAKSRDSNEIHFSQSKTGTDAANYVTISPCARHSAIITAERRRTSITEHAPDVTANYSEKARSRQKVMRVLLSVRANAQIRREWCARCLKF